MARVLVVEDEPMGRKLMQKILGAQGYQVALASDGDSAVAEVSAAAAGRRWFDACVLDVRLGDEDGLDVLIRLQEEDPEMPVIIYTAYSDAATAVRALRRRAFDLVEKTPDYEPLVDAIERARAQAEAERSAFRALHQGIRSLHDTLNTCDAEPAGAVAPR